MLMLPPTLALPLILMSTTTLMMAFDDGDDVGDVGVTSDVIR